MKASSRGDGWNKKNGHEHEHPDFPIANLSLGIVPVRDGSPVPAVAIGDSVVDFAALAANADWRREVLLKATSQPVDVYLVPEVYAAESFSVTMDAFPRINRVVAVAREQPSFQAAHPARQAGRLDMRCASP